jgi:hypothetical protein
MYFPQKWNLAGVSGQKEASLNDAAVLNASSIQNEK